ncbi:unnamed protein product [Adineta steineri]|uniref:VWFA domain-containing protein n=1 Tax=Adineta steineri TaxID=433720 RepID=A0A815M8F6_9BILA|nr:unnamed protein product [Adineta steineri]CAF1419551.1 unnamed protein product [Adineta steineri]CAF3572674.1 unnamed protein product [Adineta steineri]CAF3651754.1 unnamed protein product [Adineta steineri]
MATCTVVSSESTASSLVKLRFPFRSDKQNANYVSQIILVIDRSGSMAGGPWKQLQSAVKAIDEMNQTLQRDAYTEPIVITYNDTVSVTNLASVAKTTASGSTDFVKAFAQVQTTIKELGSEKRIVIIFMTDGCDSCNRPNALLDAQTKLSSFIRKNCSNCVVHVIGYSKDHDLNMMNTLKTLGTTDGIYRYAEGSVGLDEKFRELFEFADLTVEFTIKLPNIKEPIKITGEMVDIDHVEAECWLSLDENMKESIEINIGNNQYDAIPKFTEPDTIFTLKSLSKRANEIKTQQELDQLQSELQNVKMFGNSIGGTKTERQTAMDLRAELQTRLDDIHTIMGDIARGTLNQTAALAKMNDLRYADKFSKSSRQRRMNQRAVRNQSNLQLIDSKLNELKFNEETAFENVDLLTFTCCLTLNTCRDMMMDSQDDIMGVGLVVERQEHVVDAPTLISVKDVSVTILSRSACDDAIKMKINIGDAARLHGGFIASKTSAPTTSTKIVSKENLRTQSEFTRGVAAEPINTFLPLYICDAHFERVKIMLEPMLGYLFTLDISGYKSDQLLGLYSILGQMMNASPQNGSEREEIILHEFTRLCHGLLPQTLQYLGEENDLLKKFMANPTGRSKAHIQNLMTLFGYMYASGIKTIDESFRYAIVEELYRRHFSYIYHGTSDNIITDHIQSLLYDIENNENNQTESNTNDLSYVKTKNDKSIDGRFAVYARSVLKKNETNPKIPTEDIVIDFEIPERPISSMNNKIRTKMIELLSAFSTKPVQNVLDRLGIRMLDISNEQECLILRSMLVQCLRFYSNESINSAILNKTFFNAQTHYEQILTVAHEEFDSNRQKLTTNKTEQIRALELARRVVLTNDIGVFLGRMMVYAPTRGGKIFDTIISLLADRSQKQVPLLAEKINIIFTGRYKEHRDAEKEFDVLSNGLAWFADRSIINRVKEALGEDQWDDLDRLMRGRTCGHVYRLSDIPNRHGFHNSHPNPNLVVQWNT